MQLALVIGHAHATIKHPTLDSQKLLITQPLKLDSITPDGEPLIVVDRSGAGTGDRVMLTSDGLAIQQLLGVENSPIRWTVLGIVDRDTAA